MKRIEFFLEVEVNDDTSIEDVKRAIYYQDKNIRQCLDSSFGFEQLKCIGYEFS